MCGNLVSSGLHGVAFDNYLDGMTSKYRSRIRKTIKSLEDNQFACEKIDIDDAMDKQLYDLYLQVE